MFGHLQPMPHRAPLWLTLLTTLLVSHASVQAQAAPSGPASPPPAAAGGATRPGWYTSDAPPADSAGFNLLASIAYGAPTSRTYGMEFEPYGATFGLEPGYVFRNGVRLGAYAHYSLGRSVSQRYEPLLGVPFDLTSEGSSLHAGAVVGYDLTLYGFVLRYTLGLGFTRLRWDFEHNRPDPPRGFSSDHGTQYGFQMSPGLALLWRWRLLEVGLGFDYFIQTHDRIPPGALGKLLLGVRL